MISIQKATSPHNTISQAAREAAAEAGRAYREGGRNPLDLGQMFWNIKCRYGLSFGYISMLSGGVPSGAISHYTSLVTDLDPSLQEQVRGGVLKFKAARSLANIHDHARQRELAGVLLAGKVQLRQVEKLVSMAKANPQMRAERLCDYLGPAQPTGQQSAYRPLTFPGKCPRCKERGFDGQLISRQEETSPRWYVSCLHCGYEAVPEPLPLAKNRMGV